MIKPCFSPVIDLGHVLQAMVIVIAVGGGLLTSYVNLRTELDRQRAQMQVAIAGTQVRLEDTEQTIASAQADDRRFKQEMRTAVARIEGSLADLNARLASQQAQR